MVQGRMTIMMRWAAWTVAAASAAAILGCGGTGEAPVTASIPAGTTGASSSTDQSIAKGTAATDETPESVVRRLLEAMRSGDDDTAAALLTNKAREETAKHSLVVRPPGSAQATYQVGRVEYSDQAKSGAYVSSVWTEPGQSGAQSFEVVWVVRREPDSAWRVAGMATEAIRGGAPLLFNFEDPADMLRKLQQVQGDLSGG